MYDLAVIGLGPAGLEAVDIALKNNLKVIAFEKNEPGGTCLNVGCIPTKALLYSSKMYSKMKNSSKLGIEIQEIDFSFDKMLERKNNIVSKFTKILNSDLSKRITLIKQEAELLIDEDEVVISCEDNLYKAKNIIIATGSKPVELPELKFDGKFILSSDDLFSLVNLPKSITIVGSGAIGLEWAYILSNLGVDVNIVAGTQTLLLVQIILILLLLFALSIFLRFKKTLNLEKRIEPYALSPKYGKRLVLMDYFVSWYQKVNHKISNILSKSVFASKYAKKLDKYVVVTENHKSGLEIMALKVITALLLVIVAFITNVIQMQFMPLYEIGIPLLVGFFIPDIVYFFKYKIYHRALENDLLTAIIIMNNAFKSGRNITQAIEIVGSELDGLIAKEFKKMSLELSYGLDIDVIFKRFAKRVDIEEVNYLTASLTVLNKTGGDIIEVFSAIEKTMFNKKKLRLELASLTGSSRIIVYVLLGIPFFFVLVITLLNPSYFLPFVTTDLGLVLLGIMIVYYILFIIVVRKIMKVVI